MATIKELLSSMINKINRNSEYVVNKADTTYVDEQILDVKSNTTTIRTIILDA